MALPILYSPLDWMDVKFAVAIDFGRNKDPLAPVWIHFHSIESRDGLSKNDGTRDFEKVHLVHENLGFGSVITSSYSEYQYLLHAIELPVVFVDEKFLPRILDKEACSTSSSSKNNSKTNSGDAAAATNKPNHKWMMTTEDLLNSNWNEDMTPNAYYRSYRLARQIEYLKLKSGPMSVLDMNFKENTNTGKDGLEQKLCKMLDNVHLKLSVYEN